jgi:Ras-related protein Rab-1A
MASDRELYALLSDHLFKLVIIGDSGVGKSCLLLRFAVSHRQDDSFSDNYISTIGVDFVRTRQRFRTIYIEGRSVKLQIWDTAGQERFRTITSAYFRGADGALIVFDKTSSMTFEHVPDWVNEIKKYSEGSLKLLVGNKSDQTDISQVNSETAAQFAASYGMDYIETSALNASGVEEAFVKLARSLMQRKQMEPTTVSKKLGPVSRVKNGGCC